MNDNYLAYLSNRDEIENDIERLKRKFKNSQQQEQEVDKININNNIIVNNNVKLNFNYNDIDSNKVIEDLVKLSSYENKILKPNTKCGLIFQDKLYLEYKEEYFSNIYGNKEYDTNKISNDTYISQYITKDDRRDKNLTDSKISLYKRDSNNINHINQNIVTNIINNEYMTNINKDQTVNENNKYVSSSSFSNQRKKRFDLSSRMVNDEDKIFDKKIEKFHISSKDIRLVSRIKNSEKCNLLSLKKFVSLPGKAILLIIHYLLYEYDALKTSNKVVSNKINLSLMNLTHNTINIFKEKYLDILELQEVSFNQSKIVKSRNSTPIPILDLVLRTKVVDNKKLIQKKDFLCCQFSVQYYKTIIGNSSNKKIYDCNKNGIHIQETWQFDIRKKSEICRWFASEAEEYKNYILRHCYCQPVVSYSIDDYLEIRLNLLSKDSSIITSSIKWEDMIISNSLSSESTLFINYTKDLRIKSIVFDYMRFCELETFVHLWKNAFGLKNKTVPNEFREYFKSIFEIKVISYDIMKFYIYKAEMKACKVGFIKKNKYTQFDIQVIPYESSVDNEIQSLGLLNITHINKKVQIRIGEIVWFYFTSIGN